MFSQKFDYFNLVGLVLTFYHGRSPWNLHIGDSFSFFQPPLANPSKSWFLSCIFKLFDFSESTELGGNNPCEDVVWIVQFMRLFFGRFTVIIANFNCQMFLFFQKTNTCFKDSLFSPPPTWGDDPFRGAYFSNGLFNHLWSCNQKWFGKFRHVLGLHARSILLMDFPTQLNQFLLTFPGYALNIPQNVDGRDMKKSCTTGKMFCRFIPLFARHVLFFFNQQIGKQIHRISFSPKKKREILLWNGKIRWTQGLVLSMVCWPCPSCWGWGRAAWWAHKMVSFRGISTWKCPLIHKV